MPASSSDEGILLLNESRSQGIGGVTRFKIVVNRTNLMEHGHRGKSLQLRIKNEESPLLRPVYLTGPYSFYVDVRPINYDEDKRCVSRETIAFVEDLKPDERFKVELLFSDLSALPPDSDGCEKYCWIIDIMSQLAVVAFPKLDFSIRLGTTRKITKGRQRKHKVVTNPHGSFLHVDEWDSKSLWSLPPKFPEKPVHLVIITHGIFSNVGCDMLFMKDKIEKIANRVPEEINTNVVVRGCMDNMGKSAHGVHYLGKRVGDYTIRTIDELNKKYKVDKISFIGHSLGGPTQSMAVHYMAVKRPDIFDGPGAVRPANFITLASPYIGVIGDFPFYLSVPLDMGALGLTGRDLNLKYTPLTSKDGLYIKDSTSVRSKLILEIIPQPPIRKIFEKFINRTLYANVINDGIVPLRTAALLYLDWRSLAQVKKIQNKQKVEPMDELSEPKEKDSSSPEPSSSSSTDLNKSQMGEIPDNTMDTRDTARHVFSNSLREARRKNKKFGRGQTVSVTSGDETSDDESLNGTQAGKQGGKFDSAPDEASAFMSALSVLTAPVPTQEYIKNPNIRADKIVHDKVYTPSMLPNPHYQGRPAIKKVIYPNEGVNRIQERIARTWQETMTWRKVLVKIQPDSHNNIAVRRRFTNLYGNFGIAHMATEHFGEEACKKYAEL